MPDSGYAVEMITGMPVVTVPAEIDITTAEQLGPLLIGSRQEALLQRPVAAIRSSLSQPSSGLRGPVHCPADRMGEGGRG